MKPWCKGRRYERPVAVAMQMQSRRAGGNALLTPGEPDIRNPWNESVSLAAP